MLFRKITVTGQDSTSQNGQQGLAGLEKGERKGLGQAELSWHTLAKSLAGTVVSLALS